MLTVHHLNYSQSERLPWLCEELGVPYKLVIHKRAPVLAPQSIKDLNPLGQAPIIQDGDLTMYESGACAEYIVHRHGKSKLILEPAHKNYPDYIFWYHMANSTLQPMAITLMLFGSSNIKNPYVQAVKGKFSTLLGLMETHLAKKTWLAGNEFTIADIMTVFSFTTGRVFFPFELNQYPAILAYLQRVSKRDGYRRAREKADPGMELMIDGNPPQSYSNRLKTEKEKKKSKM